MRSVPNQTAVSVPLLFLAAGSSIMAASSAGALYCLVQLWRLDGDTVGWLVASAIFTGVGGAILPMMAGLGYGRSEVRRLLRAYGSPLRVVHAGKRRHLVISGKLPHEDETRRAA